MVLLTYLRGFDPEFAGVYATDSHTSWPKSFARDEVTDEDDTYQSRVHLVNLKTGKVLGEDED